MTSIVPAGRLGYGMQMPIQAQSRMFVADWELTAGPDELVAIAKACDDAGFLYVAVCDHVTIPEAYAPRMGAFWADTIATLGWLAAVTTRTRLLSHVFVPAYRHPLVAAKSFATLDWLSQGRAIVGVGAGHLEPEFGHLGVDFERRGALLDAAIDRIDAALREEVVDGFALAPRPVQSPRPPIWVGGSARPSLRRAAERGDGWLPQGTPRAQMPEQIAYLLDHRRSVGREDPIDLGAIAEFMYVGTPTWDVGAHVTSGSPDRLAESLLELGAMGVSHVQVRFAARSADEMVDQITAFGAEVGPLLTTS